MKDLANIDGKDKETQAGNTQEACLEFAKIVQVRVCVCAALLYLSILSLCVRDVFAVRATNFERPHSCVASRAFV